ncbi:unnamed protein product [Cladocopium goreaui]|uniref:Protein C10 n=1 Tax=Cladocopium goreaui TaxID=2562237 RepID=A0A9P1BQ62_9DINO|nr:unnamed protein product [Cladocopium goreaui]
MSAPDLSLQDVLDLQVIPWVAMGDMAELYDGFSDPGFQEALAELEAIHGKAYRNYTDDHTKLFLTVQNKVLPRYGFETGQAGVLQMLSVGAKYNDNEEFCSNRALLNELIGMAPAIGEVPAPEKKAAPRPYSQQLLITESLRWAPTLTTRCTKCCCPEGWMMREAKM